MALPSESVALLPEKKQTAANGRWLNKVIDVDEAKDQMLFALPMILTNMAYYLIPLISVMFAGHLGEHELAASNLANSWASVSGLALMVKQLFFSTRKKIVLGITLPIMPDLAVCLTVS